jgi:hypothetical protein
MSDRSRRPAKPAAVHSPPVAARRVAAKAPLQLTVRAPARGQAASGAPPRAAAQPRAAAPRTLPPVAPAAEPVFDAAMPAEEELRAMEEAWRASEAYAAPPAPLPSAAPGQFGVDGVGGLAFLQARATAAAVHLSHC